MFDDGLNSLGDEISTMDLTERRIAPRFKVNIPAFTELASKDRCPVRVHDISVSGLAFVLENRWLRQLMPVADRPSESSWVSITLNLLLPNVEAAVEVRLQIIYIRRLTMETSMMGCRFEAFSGHGARDLAEYLFSLGADKQYQNILRELTELDFKFKN